MNQPSSFRRRGLWITVGLAAGSAGLVNALIAWTGAPIDRSPPVIPAGWAWVDRVVGYVWVGLLLSLGGAWWTLSRVRSERAAKASYFVIALAVVCLLYPFTFGQSPKTGLAGNVLIGLFAALTAWKARTSSRIAAWLVLPVVLWLVVAAVYVSLLLAVNAR